MNPPTLDDVNSTLSEVQEQTQQILTLVGDLQEIVGRVINVLSQVQTDQKDAKGQIEDLRQDFDKTVSSFDLAFSAISTHLKAAK